MLKCKVCKLLLGEDKFHRDSNTRRGYDYRCKDCEKTRSERRSVNNRLYVRETKNKPCMDCGNVYPYFVMDYDHREDEEKKFELSQCYGHGISLRQIKIEIEKCDLVCANCHRIRTYKRKKNQPTLIDKIKNMPLSVRDPSKGETHHKTNLTEDLVRLIHQDTRKLRIIAKEYGVSEATVHGIKSGRVWKHLDLLPVPRKYRDLSNEDPS